MRPFALVAVVYLAFTFLVWRRESQVVGHDYAFGPHAVRNLLEYLVRMFVPLTAESATVRLPGAWDAALRGLFSWGGIALAALLAYAVVFTRMPRTWKFALLLIPVAILPVTFLTLRTSPRYLYLPSAGLAAFLGMAWAQAWESGRRRGLVVALVAVLVLQIAVMQVVLAKRGGLARSESTERRQKNSPEAEAPGEPLGTAKNAR